MFIMGCTILLGVYNITSQYCTLHFKQCHTLLACLVEILASVEKSSVYCSPHLLILRRLRWSAGWEGGNSLVVSAEWKLSPRYQHHQVTVFHCTVISPAINTVRLMQECVTQQQRSFQYLAFSLAALF